MIELQSESKYRPSDWRWKRAAHLRQHGRMPFRGNHDIYVRKAKAYQGERAVCTDEWALCALAEVWPALDEAYRIYSGRYPPTKRELESRLLTGPDLAHISARSCLELEVVRWYEALFFNVSDRLHDPSWVVNYVLGPVLHESLADRDVDLIWRLLAYAYGAIAVEHLLYVVPSAGVPFASVDEATSRFDSGARGLATRRNFLNLLTLKPGDNYQKLHLLEIVRSFWEMEKNSGGGGVGSEVEALLAHIEAAAKALPWGVGVSGRAGSGVKSIGLLDPADAGAGERRLLVAVAERSGGEISVGASTMPPAVFPERQRVN